MRILPLALLIATTLSRTYKLVFNANTATAYDKNFKQSDPKINQFNPTWSKNQYPIKQINSKRPMNSRYNQVSYVVFCDLPTMTELTALLSEMKGGSLLWYLKNNVGQNILRCKQNKVFIEQNPDLDKIYIPTDQEAQLTPVDVNNGLLHAFKLQKGVSTSKNYDGPVTKEIDVKYDMLSENERFYASMPIQSMYSAPDNSIATKGYILYLYVLPEYMEKVLMALMQSIDKEYITPVSNGGDPDTIGYYKIVRDEGLLSQFRERLMIYYCEKLFNRMAASNFKWDLAVKALTSDDNEVSRLFGDNFKAIINGAMQNLDRKLTKKDNLIGAE